MSESRTQFAVALEKLIESLQAGEPGAIVREKLEQVGLPLAQRDVIVAAEADALLVNGESLPESAAPVLHAVLRANGVSRVSLSASTTPRDLLQFAALLFDHTRTDSQSFVELWQARGRWDVRVEAAEAKNDDANTFLAEAPDTDGSHGGDDPLAQAVRAVRVGASWSPGTAVGDLLAQAGADATRLLLEQLAQAGTAVERRRLFDAIVGLRTGFPHIVRALFDPAWYVARNAAMLVGEMRIADGERALAELLSHQDARVRVAAVTAMSRLDTPQAQQTIERFANDTSPLVRAEVWRAFAARTEAPPPTTVANALRMDRDLTVLRHVLTCLERHPHPQAAPHLIRLCARMISERQDPAITFDAIELLIGHRPRAVPTLLRAMLDSGRPWVQARAQLLELRLQQRLAELGSDIPG